MWASFTIFVLENELIRKEYLYDGNGTKMPKDGFGRRIVKHR